MKRADQEELEGPLNKKPKIETEQMEIEQAKRIAELEKLLAEMKAREAQLTAENKALTEENEILVEKNEALEEEYNFIKSNVGKRAQIHKEQIHKSLEKILSTQMDGGMLADIVLTEEGLGILETVGRPQVEGSSIKQMRHVIPYGFVKRYVDHIVASSRTPTELLENLKPVLVNFANHDKGLAFKKSDLQHSPLKHKKAFIKESANTVLTSGDEKYYLLNSPKKIFSPETTPTKPKQARAEYREKNKLSLEHMLEFLINAIPDADENTQTLCAEAMTRLIFTRSNSGEACVFPDEGNTCNYEIRLYPSKQAAEKGGEGYTMVTTEELNNMPLESINKCVRIVNNEGYKVRHALEALDKIDKIITRINTSLPSSTQVKEYNQHYNIELKLSSNVDISDYNTNLFVKGFKDNGYSAYHIAKLLYASFDFKPLEKTVLAKCSNKIEEKIEIYPSATGTKTKYYQFTDGKAYRENAIAGAKGYNAKVKFRGEEVDLDLLARKSVEMVDICIRSYDGFKEGVQEKNHKTEKFSNKILSAFTKLITLDYGIDEGEFQNCIDAYSTRYDTFTDTVPIKLVIDEIFIMGDCGKYTTVDNYIFI